MCETMSPPPHPHGQARIPFRPQLALLQKTGSNLERFRLQNKRKEEIRGLKQKLI